MVKTIVSESKARKRYVDLRVIKVEVTDFMNVGVREREESGMGLGRWWMVVSFIVIKNIGKKSRVLDGGGEVGKNDEFNRGCVAFVHRGRSKWKWSSGKMWAVNVPLMYVVLSGPGDTTGKVVNVAPVLRA